jgi:hypothetical protein
MQPCGERNFLRPRQASRPARWKPDASGNCTLMLQRERSRSTTLEIPLRHYAMHLKKSVATDYRALVENQTGAGDGPALCVQPKRRRHISRQRRYRIPTHMAICCYTKRKKIAATGGADASERCAPAAARIEPTENTPAVRRSRGRRESPYHRWLSAAFPDGRSRVHLQTCRLDITTQTAPKSCR